MPYDPLTLWLIVVFMTVLTSGILLLARATTPNSDALSYWAGSLLLSAIMVAGIAARGSIPNFVSIELANAVGLTGTGLLWLGFRRFEGRALNVPAVFVAPAIWIAACQLPLFHDSISRRVVLASLLLVAILLGCIRELWLGRGERMVARTMALTVLVLHTLAVASRPIVVQTMELDGYDGFILRADPVFAAYGLAALAFVVVMAFTLVALVRERRELAYKRAALVDDLTGLLNRRGFMGSAVQACAPGRPFAVLALDLDRFKDVNDRHGHATGDDLLAMFARVLRENVRATDVVARMGGEEFGVLMPDVAMEAARDAAERIRSAFQVRASGMNLDGVAGTVSIGVVVGLAPPDAALDSIGPMLARADAALYRAKAQGRDRVETSWAGTPSPLRAVI